MIPSFASPNSLVTKKAANPIEAKTMNIIKVNTLNMKRQNEFFFFPPMIPNIPNSTIATPNM